MKKIKRFLKRNRAVPVIFLSLIALGIFSIGCKLNYIRTEMVVLAEDREAVQEQINRTKELAGAFQDLKAKQDLTPTYQTPDSVKELSRIYIRKYFGADAAKVEKVMFCESGLDPRRGHQNKEGLGADWGLYQINDKWHKSRFEKMFGVKFEVGVFDLDLSSQYAKFLYQNSGLNPWVCSRIVNT